MMDWTRNRYRLKQLILYIADQMREAPYFGETKLNKVLYRSEFAAFRELGAPLTHYRYFKNEHGPTLRAYLPITREMEAEGLLGWEMRQQGPQTERRPVVPQGSWDGNAFAPEEFGLIDEEIRRAYDQTGKQVSNEEHTTAVWFATRMGENIPPELAFVEDPGVIIPLSDEEQEWAAAAIERFRSRTETL
jgi:antitoxin SocA-like protein